MEKNAEKLVKYIVGLLKEERLRQGVSYAKLADKAGIHYTTISLIERGKQSPTLLVCKKLSDALGIKLGTLIKKAEDAI